MNTTDASSADRPGVVSPEARTALIDQYDCLLLDLDGVVYRSKDAVPNAVEAIQAARDRGIRSMFVTNNASRAAADVAAHLCEFGLDVSAADVITSSMVAAQLLRDTIGGTCTVLPVGGPGLAATLRAAGFTLVTSATDVPAAVVQGYGPDVGWKNLAEAGYAIQAGALWVATNTDATIPTARGFAPGNGQLVAAVRAVAGKDPLVAGKPEPAPFWQAAAAAGGSAPLVVGDRLDTDIAGGKAAGHATVLVLTGVDRTDSLLAAAPQRRPTYIVPDLSALFEPAPVATIDGATARCGRAEVTVVDGDIIRGNDEDSNPDPCDLLRATCALLWQERDRGGAPPAVSPRVRRLLP